MTFQLIEWNKDLDLTKFYVEAARRGFENNSSQKVMIDCFKNEREFNAWILYRDKEAVGSVAAHSFDDVMGENSYRICVRTCSFAELRPNHVCTLSKLVRKHQIITAQFYIPKNIEWVNNRGDIYITSNDSPTGSQRIVHRIYFPNLAKTGTVSFVKDVHYRGHIQSVWKLNPLLFLEQLNENERWN